MFNACRRIWIADFPFKYPTTIATLYFGGILNTLSSGIRPSSISRAPWVKAAPSGVIFPTRPSRLLSPRLSLTNLLENPSNGITKLYGITLSGEEWRKIMAILDELLESKVVTGLAVVIGAATLAPVIVPIVTGVLRPVAKSIIKGGILLYEKGRETGAEF